MLQRCRRRKLLMTNFHPFSNDHFRNELEDALEAAHDRRRNLLLDSVNKEERLLQGNMMLEEEVLVTKKRAEDELLNAKQLSHNAKQEIERLTQVNQLLQADVDR